MRAGANAGSIAIVSSKAARALSKSPRAASSAPRLWRAPAKRASATQAR
jgi:hypothetical protein